MSSTYTDVVFQNSERGITARKLNKLRDDLSTAIASAGSGTAPSGTLICGETPAGLINGANKVYTSVNAYNANTLAVFLNGIRQRRTNDYTETSTTTFTFIGAPLAGDSISIDYIKT